MNQKEIDYRGYLIRIIPQPKKGDLDCVYFSVSKGNKEEIIRLWQKMSGTSKSKAQLSDLQAFETLEQDGLNYLKNLIDKEEFPKEEFTLWSGN